jgi:hypothetical protein
MTTRKKRRKRRKVAVLVEVALTREIPRQNILQAQVQKTLEK